MASRLPAEADSAGGRLSAELAHYYARIYASAKAGCLAELRYAGCSEEEAEEVFAATLEQIMTRRDPPREGFAPAQTIVLLKRACKQRLIDECRHRDVLRVLPLADTTGHADRAREDPVEVAEDRDVVAIGCEAISSLPKRHRRLFLQRHRLGLSPEEILRLNPGLTSRTYRRIMQRANARALAAFEQIASGERCAEMRDGQLHRYVSEEASDAELGAIRAHLLHCRSCGLEVARMRGHLHEVATGLAAFLTDAHLHGHLIGDLPARLLEAVWHGGEALASATRAARERLRELAIRAATASPSSGGESAVGQIAGLSGAKAASICAAGAITASCLAAGVVPGVAGLESEGKKQATRNPEAPRSVPSPPEQHSPAEAPRSSGASASQQSPKRISPEDRTTGSTQRAHSSSSAAHASRPTISGQQTGTEFGAEAAGAGVPAPTFYSGSSGSSGASSEGGTVSSSGNSGAGGGGSKSKPEFGL